MTKQRRHFRKGAASFLRAGWPIMAVLVLAAVLRLDGIGFGLPALNDPDEPLFMMLAFDMLNRGSLDPQWFGHPGTITLYSLAAVMVAVAGAGLASGAFADLNAFASAVYADPGLVILPARIMIAACSVLCVWLTYLIGLRLWGKAAGLVAALMLAVNAVHITWSQIIRTDVQASVFMLLCVLAAMNIARRGLARDYVLAGMFAGLACATKWPAALIGLSALAAAAPAALRGNWRKALLIPLAAGAALLIASPFLLFSYDRVLHDLAGEARTAHPGATGGGPLDNLWWYVSGPLAQSFGLPGLVLAIAGLVGATYSSRIWRIAVLPGFAVFLAAICVQSLVWERWLVPLLPFFALCAGWALQRAASALQRPTARIALPLATTLAIVPMAIASYAASAERRTDTRQLASAWIFANAPPGSTILVEHAAVDLVQGPYTVLFPFGAAGCIDGGKVLRGQVSPAELEANRQGNPVVDLGDLKPAQFAACRADFAVLTHFDRYRQDQVRFPQQWANYYAFVRGGNEAAILLPNDGEVGGSPVRIIAFGDH